MIQMGSDTRGAMQELEFEKEDAVGADPDERVEERVSSMLRKVVLIYSSMKVAFNF